MKRTNLLQPLVLGTILAGGFMVAWAVVGLWTVEIGAACVGAGSSSEKLVFLADGTPLIAYQTDPQEGRQFRDLDGNPVVPPDRENNTWAATTPLPASLPLTAGKGDVSWEERLRSFADGGNPVVYWYFVTDGRTDGTGYFVGYDSQSKTRVGYIGTAGFREDTPPAGELFPFGGAVSGPRSRLLSTQPDGMPANHPDKHAGGKAPPGSVSTWDVYLLGRDGKLYHTDLQQRKTHVIPVGQRMRSLAMVAGFADPVRGTPHRVAVRTDEAVLILDELGGGLACYPIPEEVRESSFRFGESTAGEAIFERSIPAGRTIVEHRIWWVMPDSQSRRTTVALAAGGDGLRLEVLASAVVVPSPLGLLALLGWTSAGNLLGDGQAATYSEALAQTVVQFWPAFAGVQILAAALALLCRRRLVRYQASRAEQVAWPLFLLVLGLPGWIAFRFGRSWPVLEACPACETAVPRDRECCACCENEFPRPALRGTEVFA
jgi:hypothetical protein